VFGLDHSRVVSETAEGGDYENKREPDSDDDSDAVDEGLTAGLAVQGFHTLGIDSGLQRANLDLLLRDLLLLVGDLLFEAGSHGRLPLLSLFLFYLLAILLDLLIAGIAHIPDQAGRARGVHGWCDERHRLHDLPSVAPGLPWLKLRRFMAGMAGCTMGLKAWDTGRVRSSLRDFDHFLRVSQR
jgi:hypothetical protein